MLKSVKITSRILATAMCIVIIQSFHVGADYQVPESFMQVHAGGPVKSFTPHLITETRGIRSHSCYRHSL